MAARQCQCAICHSTVHVNMAKMANCVMCILPQCKKIEKSGRGNSGYLLASCEGSGLSLHHLAVIGSCSRVGVWSPSHSAPGQVPALGLLPCGIGDPFLP